MKFLGYLLLERNIINLDAVEAVIHDILMDLNAMRAVVPRTDFEKIEKWIKSNLKNFILRDYGNVQKLSYTDSYVTNRARKEKWIQKAIDRGDELYAVNLTVAFRSNIDHVLDYFTFNPNINISRISVPEAIRQSEEWTKQQNKKASDQEDVQGIQEVRKYSDGFHWVKVTSKQALDREGKLMKHCVGSYCDQVSVGSTSIYSLRDKKNEPHCTIELKQGSINQIKGKANGPVDKKYVKYVKDFVLKPIVGEKYAKVSDLKNIGLVEIEGKIYDINNLPKNLEIKGHLYLGGCTSLTSLPSGLKVGGYLYLSNCTSLTSLPSGLKVGGHLYLSNCTSLTSLPSGLKVGRDLDLSNCISLTSLPSGLKVGGDLYLGGCTSLTSLPNDLEVKEKICVSNNMMKYFKDSKFKDQIR